MLFFSTVLYCLLMTAEAQHNQSVGEGGQCYPSSTFMVVLLYIFNAVVIC